MLDDAFSCLPCKQNVLLARDIVLEKRGRFFFSYKRDEEIQSVLKIKLVIVTHQLTNAIQVIQEVFD